MKKRNQTGFTLYELMITLLIVGVVLSYGIPNLAEFTANSRITSTSNDLHASFQLARSEAARAKTNITICASADPLAADSDCDGAWSQGYIVFVDDNGDLARAGAEETLLRAHSTLSTTMATWHGPARKRRFCVLTRPPPKAFRSLLPTTLPFSATRPLDSAAATYLATRHSARSLFAINAAQPKHQRISRQHACL